MDKSFTLLLALANNYGVGGTQIILDFYTRCRLKNLTRRTLQYYAINISNLVMLAHRLNRELDTITKGDLESHIIGALDNGLRATSINTRLKAYRAFYAFAAKEGLIDAPGPMAEISLLKEDKRYKPVLDAEQMTLLLNSFHCRTFTDTRNKQMALLGLDGMLRLGEIVNVDLNHLLLPDRLIKVFGKSRIERWVPISTRTAKSLHQYIIRWRRSIPGPALCCKQDGERLNFWRLQKIFKRQSERTGIPFSSQTLRRSGATMFINRGGSIPILQRILGHSDPRITLQNYTHPAQGDVRQAHDQYGPVGALQ